MDRAKPAPLIKTIMSQQHDESVCMSLIRLLLFDDDLLPCVSVRLLLLYVTHRRYLFAFPFFFN